MPAPTGGRHATEAGGGRASGGLRIAMEETEVGEDNMDEGEGDNMEGENAEAERRRLGGDLLVLEATSILTKYTEPGITTR